MKKGLKMALSAVVTTSPEPTWQIENRTPADDPDIREFLVARSSIGDKEVAVRVVRTPDMAFRNYLKIFATGRIYEDAAALVAALMTFAIALFGGPILFRVLGNVLFFVTLGTAALVLYVMSRVLFDKHNARVLKRRDMMRTNYLRFVLPDVHLSAVTTPGKWSTASDAVRVLVPEGVNNFPEYLAYLKKE